MSEPVTHTDASVEAIREQLAKLEKFMARRFDEISMEINATAQQLDMAEQDIVGRFSGIMQTLSSISYSGTGDTAANAGVELEAVIVHTEQAATKIMDSVDKINARFAKKDDWVNAQTRFHMIEDSKRDLQSIMLACSFQDLVSQRIRKALESLNLIEEKLTTTLDQLGIPVHVSEEDTFKMAEANRGASQADIDALFN